MMLRKKYHLLFVFLLLLLPVGRYYQTVSGYWRWDDTAILLQLLKTPVWKYFFIPKVYQLFSCANFTPWVMLSYQGDLTLFGLNPAAFYLHHLFSLSFIAVAGYYFLSLWVKEKFAFAGMVLFVNGACVATVVQQLMTRHYLEGLLFAILALMCFVLYLRQGNHCYLIVGAVFYLLSVTAKEIYVPLVCLLPWIPERSMKLRLKAMIPFVMVALFYVFWRRYMLGSLVGGYVGNPRELVSSALTIVLDGFASMPALLFGPWWKPLLMVYLGMLLFSVLVTSSRFLLVIVVFACIILPLVPVAVSPGIAAPDRYLLLAWFTVVFSSTCCFDGLYGKILLQSTKTVPFTVMVIFLMLLSMIGTYGYNSGKRTRQLAREYDTLGRFVWRTHDREVYFIPPPAVLASYWFVDCLSKIKRRVCQGRFSPVGVIDDLYLPSSVKKLWSYDVKSHGMKDVTASLEERRARAKAAVRQVPLSIFFTYAPGQVAWRFGPYATGSYHLLADELGARPLPREGALRVRIDDDFSFRIRYTSPEGWKTYSPPFRFKAQGMDITWEQK